MSPDLQPVRYVATAALWLLLGLTALDASAQAGGQPLILDTQTGIHSGAGGTVLQTGPLNGAGMAPARPMATLPELPQQDQQTIIVSPYIELQQGKHHAGQGYGSSTGSQPSLSTYPHGPRSTSPQSSASYGVSTAVQTQGPVSTQPAVPQASKSPSLPPIIAPVPTATPKSVATKTTPTLPVRSSDPHSQTGAVTTLLD